jgi:hypothetical protein
MRRMFVVLAAVGMLAVAAPAPASAGVCRTVKCFNKQVFRLQSQVVELQTALNCLQPVAVTRYGGYDYNGVAASTTAIDYTESGDNVSTWVVGIEPGTCNAPQTRAGAQSASRASGTDAREAFSFGPFQAIPGVVERSRTGG